jgi:hypothetical protein
MLYWGAPTFDTQEERHSPGQILVAMIIANAQQLGLQGIDFTLGVEEYKKRFGNECINLPSIDLYGRISTYRARQLRDQVVRLGKKMASGREETLLSKLSRFNDRLKHSSRKASQMGLKRAAFKLAQRSIAKGKTKQRGLIYVAQPLDVRKDLIEVVDGNTCIYHSNHLRDLAKWEDLDPDDHAELSRVVRGSAKALSEGHVLHTVVINDSLAGWGWSYWPKEPSFITETQTYLEFEPNSVSLYNYHVVSRFRGRRLYTGLLTHVLTQRFAEGAQKAYIMCLESNMASQKGIERAGFRLVRIDTYKIPSLMNQT